MYASIVITKHLVLSTMHTRNAKGAIYRLIEFGVNPLEIEQTIVAITAQRLVELSCPFCERECSPYCYCYGRWKRASVFELLAGRALNAVMKEAKGEEAFSHYKTLKDIIKKGIALGYIKETEYDRWVLDNEKR